MQRDSFEGIINRYASLSHTSITNRELIVSNTANTQWLIRLDDKILNIKKRRGDGRTELVCSMPYAGINRCWIEYRRIPYLIIRTGYPIRKIYVPFPGISPDDRERILVAPIAENKAKNKCPARKFENEFQKIVNGKQVVIYTDGTCHRMDKNGNGIGGWAYSITVEGKEIACGARIERIVTNGDMEIKAAAMGLKRLFGCTPEYIIVMSDYQDVSKFGRKLFRPKFSDPRKNAFNILEDAIRTTHCTISWMWVKGHKGNHFNTLCDKRLRLLLKRHLTECT